MIEAYGETVFKLSLNKQRRTGDAVRQLDFDAIRAKRDGTGLTDTEIGERIGLLSEQVGVVRIFMERKYHRIDQHRRIFALGGGRRWNKDDYEHPEERLKFNEAAMELREALAFPPGRVAHYLERGDWTNETLGGWLARAADQTPEAPAIIEGGDVISYGELKARAEGLAVGLMRLSLMKGDVISVDLPGGAQFLAAYLAIASFGGVMLPEMAQSGKARAFVCQSRDHDLANFEHVIIVGDEAPAGSVKFEDLISDEPLVTPNPPVGADPVLLLSTPGDNPKGVPLTYQNILSAARHGGKEFNIQPADRLACPEPLGHPISLFTFHMALGAGGAVLIGDGPEKPSMAFLDSSQPEKNSQDCLQHPLWGRAEFVGVGGGHEVRVNVEGEAEIRGCSLFPGYLNDPAATEQAFTDDGWFRTGQTGTLDKDGKFTP
jgi:acyl-coenzyme A synthetase/AMP-(fatty) acid ligase